MESLFRKLRSEERETLIRLGNSSSDWDKIEVDALFRPEQVVGSHLEGVVRIGRNARIFRSTVRNYAIGEESLIEGVTALECRHKSRFGEGVMISTMNECEGRQVKIYSGLTSQIAYLLAIYRHRPKMIARLEALIEREIGQEESSIGSVGHHCRITGSRLLREVKIGNRVTIDGASILENGTLLDDSYVGIDVKAYNFILAEDAHLSNGVIVEQCFIGERVILGKAFSASESLFFANSHCENGEASNIFAGPYTVSHHKSSLLIAGMFSFFNAGSGANQSNHLFKSGAVHQSVHLRGCKFASGAYVMSPALEGAFTMILGHHSFHHDTSAFPYSYLIEKEGRSMLMPGANLASSGAVRDVEKWPKRDRRRIKRDQVSLEEYNPYICQSFVEGLNTLNALYEEEPDAETYTYKHTFIKPNLLKRGVNLYRKAVVASLGEMLSKGEVREEIDGTGRWLDVGGQYIAKSYVEALLSAIEEGRIDHIGEVAEAFSHFHKEYDHYARHWATVLYSQLLGHYPSDEEIREAIRAGRNAHSTLRETTDADRMRDCSMEMAISYGLDAENEEDRRADYYNVRGLN